MAQVMTKAVQIKCTHPTAGTVTVTGSPKLVLGTEEVLTAAGVAGAPVAGCVPGPAPAVACATCLPVSSGKATKLEVSGSPVLLAGFMVKTSGTPPTVVVAPLPPN